MTLCGRSGHSGALVYGNPTMVNNALLPLDLSSIISARIILPTCYQTHDFARAQQSCYPQQNGNGLTRRHGCAGQELRGDLLHWSRM